MSRMKMSFYDDCIANNKLALLSEWHPIKNKELTPQNVPFKSVKKVWWKCKKGHEWKVAVYNRASGSDCPYCAGKRAIKGFNDLTTVAPEVAAQWHPTLNEGLTPETIMPKSSKKVWWQCKEGHEWQAMVHNRVSGSGCPYCSGRLAIKGATDLATVAPEVAAQWHPTLNEGLTPEAVTAHSQKKVWWQCKEGHEWQVAVYNRVSGTGCPYCAGQRVIKGVNDLATVAPEVAAQWHPTKNGVLTPDMVTKYSIKKVWWKCKEGHEWQAVVHNRTDVASCPYCVRTQRVTKKDNALATIAPDVAAQWHPTKNGDLSPQMVTAGSQKKAWWICEKGHEWEAIVKNRTRGAGCPVCYSQTRQMRKILRETKEKMNIE